MVQKLFKIFLNLVIRDIIYLVLTSNNLHRFKIHPHKMSFVTTELLLSRTDSRF